MAGDVSILAQPEGRALLSDTLAFVTTVNMFQSSPSPKAGRSWRRRWCRPTPRTSFNPRPARRPGAPVRHAGVCHNRQHVSILAQPEGRALLASEVVQAYTKDMFQSSPSPKAGRSWRRRWCRPTPRTCFNPRPARRPGAPGVGGGAGLHQGHVSILAQPEGRALLASEVVQAYTKDMFQSSPSPKAGRSWRRRWCRPTPRTSFNPRPARRPGAPLLPAREPRHHPVSILAQPEGRALRPWLHRVAPSKPQRFNPRPARRPGAPHRHWYPCQPSTCFNPRPARRPGAPRGPWASHYSEMAKFQSSPSPKAGRS